MIWKLLFKSDSINFRNVTYELQVLTHCSTANTKTTASCSRATLSSTKQWYVLTCSTITGKRCNTSTRPTRPNWVKPNCSSLTKQPPFLCLLSSLSSDPTSFLWRPPLTGQLPFCFQNSSRVNDSLLVSSTKKIHYFSFCSYEGTGRSLSLKLIEQLRIQSRSLGGSTKEKEADAKVLGRNLAEVSLNNFEYEKSSYPNNCTRILSPNYNLHGITTVTLIDFLK